MLLINLNLPHSHHAPAARSPAPYNYPSQSIYDGPPAASYGSGYGGTHSQSPAALPQHYSLSSQQLQQPVSENIQQLQQPIPPIQNPLPENIQQPQNQVEVTCACRTSRCLIKQCSAVRCTALHQYCRSLSFDQRPDYGFLKRLFRDLFTREGYEFDYIFDWTILKYQQTQRAKTQPQSSNLLPVSGAISRQAMPMNVKMHQGGNGTYVDEVTEHRESSNLGYPDGHMQFRSTIAQNQSADYLIEKHTMSNAREPSTSFVPPNVLKQKIPKPDEQPEAENGHGLGGMPGASRSWMPSLHHSSSAK